MQNTISARQLQREYKKVLKKANRIKKPLIVISNNQPQGAIIGLDLLERLRLETLAEEAIRESNRGETVIIDTPQKLEKHFKELEKEVETA